MALGFCKGSRSRKRSRSPSPQTPQFETPAPPSSLARSRSPLSAPASFAHAPCKTTNTRLHRDPSRALCVGARRTTLEIDPNASPAGKLKKSRRSSAGNTNGGTSAGNGTSKRRGAAGSSPRSATSRKSDAAKSPKMKSLSGRRLPSANSQRDGASGGVRRDDAVNRPRACSGAAGMGLVAGGDGMLGGLVRESSASSVLGSSGLAARVDGEDLCEHALHEG